VKDGTGFLTSYWVLNNSLLVKSCVILSWMSKKMCCRVVIMVQVVLLGSCMCNSTFMHNKQYYSTLAQKNE